MFFFRLGMTGVQTWISGWSDKVNRHCQEIVCGRMSPELPVELVIAGGERLPDLLCGSGLCAVSPRMLNALQSVSATGYSTIPIVLTHPLLGCTVEGYSGLVIHGRGGPLDESRMQPVKKSGTAIISCQGFHIYEDRWDGSDLFVIDNLGVSVWVTERVATALSKCRPKLRNLSLTPNTEPFPGVPESVRKNPVGLPLPDEAEIEAALARAEQRDREKKAAREARKRARESKRGRE